MKTFKWTLIDKAPRRDLFETFEETHSASVPGGTVLRTTIYTNNTAIAVTMVFIPNPK